MSPARWGVAALAVAATAACVLLVLEAGERMYATLGPTRAAVAADGSLYLVSHGKLHVFASDGARRSVFDLAALGVSRRPSELALHADGRVVFADPDTSMLERCRLPAGPCERLDPGLRAAAAQPLFPLNSVRVAIDDSARRYYISDNAGHRVVIADFSGRALASSAPGMFRYPNQLAITAPGELCVADTNHHRIATFDVRGDRIGLALREVSTRALEIARPGRAWPFDAQAMPRGETWVLVANNRMRDADVVVFDAAGKATRRIDLGDDSDPFAIRPWNDRVLVADATRYRVVDVMAPGAPPALHDAGFSRELERERENVERWRQLRIAAQAGLVAIPLAAILALWKLGVPLFSAAAQPREAARRGPARGVAWIAIAWLIVFATYAAYLGWRLAALL
jgi:sugar lactone lactonase YvrE